jgi:META domain
MTMKTCPEDAMGVEAQVLTVLDGPVDYSIDGSTLTVTKGDAGLLFKGRSTPSRGRSLLKFGRARLGLHGFLDSCT